MSYAILNCAFLCFFRKISKKKQEQYRHVNDVFWSWNDPRKNSILMDICFPGCNAHIKLYTIKRKENWLFLLSTLFCGEIRYTKFYQYALSKQGGYQYIPRGM